MAFGDSDLDTFFMDGVDVVFGSQTTKGWLDQPEHIFDELRTLGGVQGTELSLTYKTTALSNPAPKSGDAITVDSVSYAVREVLQLDDGKISKATLRKP